MIRGLGKCKVRGRYMELVGGVWFVKMGGETSGWFVVYMKDGVKKRFVVAHDKTNGQWEL